MTFRDIAEKGKPETDNLIVLKIVLRCQNSSHTFSNLFNKKPESASFRCVVLEHRPLVSWLFDSRDREVLFDRTLEDCLKMSSLRYPGLKQSITLTYGQEVGGLCHQPCQTQFGMKSHPSLAEAPDPNTSDPPIGLLYRKTSTVHPKFRLVYVNLTLLKTAYLDLDWWLRIDFTRY